MNWRFTDDMSTERIYPTPTHAVTRRPYETQTFERYIFFPHRCCPRYVIRESKRGNPTVSLSEVGTWHVSTRVYLALPNPTLGVYRYYSCIRKSHERPSCLASPLPISPDRRRSHASVDLPPDPWARQHYILFRFSKAELFFRSIF